MIKLRSVLAEGKVVSNQVGMLEERLFMVYMCCEIIWLPLVGIASFFVGLKLTALIIFGVFLIAISLAMTAQKTGKIVIVRWIYMILTLFKVPLLWYVVGGNVSSAGALFLLEIIFYSMINRGKIQIIFIVLSMITSSMASSLSGRFPDKLNGLNMSPMQHSIMSAVVGSSITLFVTFLIVYQKREFNRENKLARETDEQLKLSNQMQKNFLANMSHKIRSPLGIVLGFNDLILDSEDEEKIKEYATNIKDAGKTLQTVINDILDYSKIEAGKLDILESDYLISTLIKELEKDIRLRCNEKGLIFNVEKIGEIPDSLYGDCIRIKQCIFNILTNAVKYTDSGSVTFTIECKGKDVEGYNIIVFTVKDTGRGMSKDLIPKLFTSFQRLDEGQNRGIEGTGLGLAITKSLLDQMSGTVNVESEMGVGSTFVITIGQKDGSEDLISSNADEEVDMSCISGKNVLVVDDVDMNLVIIDTILTSEGLNITTVTSGQAAIDSCKEKKFDVILLDHMMPGMDGIETYNNIKANGLNTDTPVIMLTANAMAGAKEEYYSHGINGYVTKPINQNLLNREIVRVTK